MPRTHHPGLCEQDGAHMDHTFCPMSLILRAFFVPVVFSPLGGPRIPDDVNSELVMPLDSYVFPVVFIVECSLALKT